MVRMRVLVIGAALLLGCARPEPAVVTPANVEPKPTEATRGDAEDELSERIRKVVLAERSRLRACYEEGLARTPALQGRVVLVLDVGQNGMAAHVFEAHREGLGEEEVKCFARVLESARFHDGAARAVKIQVPLAFAPGS
jgi:hypothetical protein